jgi:uncharacterized protein with HEPN domain
MSKRSDIDLIDDILICLSKIQEYIDRLSYDDFVNDHKTQDAIIRNIEIIGEATKRLSTEITEKYSNIPWEMIAGTRDRLIHGYFGVNIDIVWEIATIDVPDLEQEIKKIKKEYFG